MSSLTPRLQLKKWDGSDPFRRIDFDDNSDKLDAAPGLYVCTSGSLPAWTAQQANRCVWLTDERRIMEWSGTAWREPQQFSPSFASTASINQLVPTGVVTTYGVGSVDVQRPGQFLMMMNYVWGVIPTYQQECDGFGLVDTQKNSEAAKALGKWCAIPGAASESQQTGVSLTGGSLTKGIHTISAQIYANTFGGPQVRIRNVTWSLFMTERLN